MRRFGQKRGAALAALVVIGAIAAALALFALLSRADVSALKDSAGVVQALMTAIAIGIGGAFAWFKLQIFRDLTPHLTISHEVSHRIISPSYALIDVTVVLHNGSKVHVELREAIFRLQLVAPLFDEEVAELHDEMYANNGQGEATWPLLVRTRRDWGEGELIVEPGESHRETCEFIVSTDVAAVHIYTFFHNPSWERGVSSEGWRAATIYDMRDSDGDM